ncbi:Mediator of RNA polymerase II transcription subunit 4 [Erysiphe neolycopersici]|uniref:Mediator of RNA polymerase II transcription subunit 4 n=1 Tax=Erysiphe neolycopersici TaxID=212602 RepID=A0A420HTD8_9PEZI|nr:Mediator of RNA polymerase II transcription subunit 4 [Erysiphe neolycopersici]
MDSVLKTHFKRVEVALASLIDSIAKFNPNPIHARDLVAANAELDKGLQQRKNREVTVHQLNYARIISLRNTSKALDNQIRDSLEQLAVVRKEVASTPATKPPPVSSVNSVSYIELLDYARRISKFTSPPSYRDPITSEEIIDKVTISKTSNDVSKLVKGIDEQPNNLLESTNGQHQRLPSVQKKIEGEAIVSTDAAPTSQISIINNNNIWFEYLNPRSDKPWTPWPYEETIRRGALASIQVLINQGIDPATFDPEKGAELEAERKRLMDEEDQHREEQKHQNEAQRKLQRSSNMRSL